MRTLVSDPPPADFEAFMERRRLFGGDRLDEVWEGVLHMNPTPSGAHAYIGQQLAEILGPVARTAGLVAIVNTFNLGTLGDFRIPDGGVFREPSFGVWYDTVALAIEILSPGDETWEKLPFYAAHGVEELIIVDPRAQTVQWLGLVDDGYLPVERSGLVELGAAELAQRLEWPPIEA